MTAVPMLYVLFAPGEIGALQGSDGVEYPVTNGVVTVPQACVAAALGAGFSLKATATVGVGTLVAGLATIFTDAVSGVGDNIILTVLLVSGQATAQSLAVPADQIVPGKSFNVVSAANTDTSTFIWQLI